MFEEQSIRLLREKWRAIQPLAEEIFSIFQTEGLITHDGSLGITPTDDTPGVVVNLPNTPTDLGPGITVTRGDTTINIAPEGITITSGDTTTTLGGGGTNLTQIVGLDSPPSQAPFVLAGRVVSGTGSNYRVNVYARSTFVSMGQVNATQLQIDPDEQIPSGTWCQVLGFPVTTNGVTTATYYLFVPIWL